MSCAILWVEKVANRSGFQPHVLVIGFKTNILICWEDPRPKKIFRRQNIKREFLNYITSKNNYTTANGNLLQSYRISHSLKPQVLWTILPMNTISPVFYSLYKPQREQENVRILGWLENSNWSTHQQEF